MLPPKLTFRNSEFALNTISERWPTILSQLIDSIYRNRETYCTAAQQDISDNLKELTRHICHLRYDIMTNKPVTFLSFPLLGSAEMELWEHLLSVFGVKLKRSDDIKPEGLHLCWYDLPWLFAECYLYRRIVDAALWANEFDLSLHPDGNFQLTGFDQVSDFMKRVEKQIVVNDGNAIHRFCKKFLDLMSLKDSDRKLRVAVILDNSGPELVADLCFAEYFVASHIAENVSFHGKSIPWFVSDVTGKDFNWLLNINNSELVFNNDSYVHLLTKWSEVWRKRIQDGSFHFRTSYFWTTPCTYDEIETVDSALYQDLSKNYDLIIFKGDLNYRKLLGDRQWKPDNPEDKINAFRRVQIGRPSSCTCSEKFGDLKPGEPITNCSCGPLVVALRVAKSDVAVGVDHDLLTELQKKTKQWWTIGKYGFIQVVSPIVFGAS
ncbi:Protein-glutamate O-methyltransferase [Schistosoma japonicum]|nr:Protein-glutamate O-methyltransferase [Schistosoma japonicum]